MAVGGKKTTTTTTKKPQKNNKQTNSSKLGLDFGINSDDSASVRYTETYVNTESDHELKRCGSMVESDQPGWSEDKPFSFL